MAVGTKPCTANQSNRLNQTVVHPARSPDLNPVESMVECFKGSNALAHWNSIEELVVVYQDEWSRVTMHGVRTRVCEINTILGRCDLLVDTDGSRIKTELW